MVRQLPVTRLLLAKGRVLKTRANNRLDGRAIRERRVSGQSALLLGLLILLLTGCASVKDSQMVRLFAPDADANSNSHRAANRYPDSNSDDDRPRLLRRRQVNTAAARGAAAD